MYSGSDSESEDESSSGGSVRSSRGLSNASSSDSGESSETHFDPFVVSSGSLGLSDGSSLSFDSGESSEIHSDSLDNLGLSDEPTHSSESTEPSETHSNSLVPSGGLGLSDNPDSGEPDAGGQEQINDQHFEDGRVQDGNDSEQPTSHTEEEEDDSIQSGNGNEGKADHRNAPGSESQEQQEEDPNESRKLINPWGPALALLIIILLGLLTPAGYAFLSIPFGFGGAALVFPFFSRSKCPDIGNGNTKQGKNKGGDPIAQDVSSQVLPRDSATIKKAEETPGYKVFGRGFGAAQLENIQMLRAQADKWEWANRDALKESMRDIRELVNGFGQWGVVGDGDNLGDTLHNQCVVLEEELKKQNGDGYQRAAENLQGTLKAAFDRAEARAAAQTTRLPDTPDGMGSPMSCVQTQQQGTAGTPGADPRGMTSGGRGRRPSRQRT